MRFMLLICHDSSFTERTVKGDSAAWLEEMERRGVRSTGIVCVPQLRQRP